MTGTREFVKWSPPGATEGQHHEAPETNPPEQAEDTSPRLEAPGPQSGRRDGWCEEAAAAESDSGDSLFITQKPVPEAARPKRRRRLGLRSDPASPRALEESGDDSSSSASCGEPQTAKRSRRKKCRLPKFSFPFLTGRRYKPRSTLLSVEQNTALHHCAMGGFFKCVREMWQDYQRDELLSSLPTVDQGVGHISPLSEEEEESGDIKVVKMKRLVASSETKHSQPWYTPSKSDAEGKQQCRRASNARLSQTRQKKILHELPAKASKSGVAALMDSSECGDSSDRALTERKTGDGSVVAQTETSKTNRRLTRGHKRMLFQEKASEDELCEDSDATMCEALERGSSRESTPTGREPLHDREPQADVSHTGDFLLTEQEEDGPESQTLHETISDTNNDKVCNERVKKKKTRGDCESTEEGKGHGQEEPEGLHATASLDVGGVETPSPSEDNPAEPLTSQTSDELPLNEETLSHDDVAPRQEERHSPVSKPMKKKRTKNKAAAEAVEQVEDGSSRSDVRLEDESLFSVTCNVVNVDKEKEKRMEGSAEDDDGVEPLQPSDISDAVNDDAETHRKKKRRKKEKTVNMEDDKEEAALNMTSGGQFEERGHLLGNTGALQETTQPSHEKRRKKQKRELLLASHMDAEVGAENRVDVSSSNDAAMGGSTGQAVKKKKKKKKKKKRRESISEEGDVSCNLQVREAENSQKTEAGSHEQDAELTSKKKKKKKKRESEKCSNVSEDAATQSVESVSVQEKKRTSSFLVANAEEKVTQTHEEQSSLCSKAVSAPVWGSGKPGVSSVDFDTESAEIPGRLEDGLGKKKSKRKMSVQESLEKDFEEADKISLPEITDTGVKRKKTRKKSECESVTPMERLESTSEAGDPATEAAVALKKKKKKKKKCKDEPGRAAQESPSAIASAGMPLKTCGSVSQEKEDSQSHCLLNLVGSSSTTPACPALKTKKHKTLKRSDDVLDKRKLSNESDETHQTEKERESPTCVPSPICHSPLMYYSDLSSSDHISKIKQKKAKKRLYNAAETFLSD